MNILVSVAALVLIVWVLWDAFETILLTRRVPARLRISRLLLDALWAIWAAVAGRIGERARREIALSFYGLFSVLMLVVVWAAGLILAFAMLHWAEGSHLDGAWLLPGPARTGFAAFFVDIYMSGTTFFTLGLGDLHPMTAFGRVLTVVEAGMGFGFLALVIAYIPVLYQAFSKREVRITMLDQWAGSPPCAAVLLRRCRESRDLGVIVPLLRDWEFTAAEILESHLSYPVLCYFRSQHDNQSWLAALIAVLDACALVIVGIEGIDPFQARLTFAIGRHALVDLSQSFMLRPLPPEDLRTTEQAVAEMREWLASAGLVLRSGADADRKLHELRGLYLPFAHRLSQELLMPLPPWLPPAKARFNWQSTVWSRTGSHSPLDSDAAS